MTFDELLNKSKSKIEEHLLRSLYFALPKSVRGELEAQYLIDEFEDVTLPDFAFPDRKIAIYCDGYKWHKDLESFVRDRMQSRKLQLRGWIVLRFAGSEINDDIDEVVLVIQQAIAGRTVETERQALAAPEKEPNLEQEAWLRDQDFMDSLNDLVNVEIEGIRKEIKSEERHTSYDFTEGINNPQSTKAPPEQPKPQNSKSKFTRPIPKEYLQEKQQSAKKMSVSSNFNSVSRFIDEIPDKPINQRQLNKTPQLEERQKPSRSEVNHGPKYGKIIRESVKKRQEPIDIPDNLPTKSEEDTGQRSKGAAYKSKVKFEVGERIDHKRYGLCRIIAVHRRKHRVRRVTIDALGGRITVKATPSHFKPAPS